MAQQAIITEAERLRREGERRGQRQGRRQGRQEGRQGLIKEQLEQRFGPLPEEVVMRLRKADLGELERWGRRLLTAQSLAEVFAGEADE